MESEFCSVGQVNRLQLLQPVMFVSHEVDKGATFSNPHGRSPNKKTVQAKACRRRGRLDVSLLHGPERFVGGHSNSGSISA
jgi:hypothetical protein